MNFIAAVDQNWGIGKDGDLLFHIPEDMRFFRMMTKEKVVVMGRETLLSFPDAKPLKNRTNIVLSRNPAFCPEGVVVCHDVHALARRLARYNTEDIFVIGGSSVYALLRDYCRKAYVTKIDARRDADKFIADMDTLENWTQTETSEKKEHNGIGFRFVTYENKCVKPLEEIDEI